MIFFTKWCSRIIGSVIVACIDAHLAPVTIFAPSAFYEVRPATRDTKQQHLLINNAAIMTNDPTSSDDFKIRLESPDDPDAIREVNRRAFGREDEGRLVDELRAEGYARLSLVAQAESGVIGHLLLSSLPIVTEGGGYEALALAPMSVLPDHQRRGVGSALVREGIRMAREMGFPAIIVLGHPAYYPRFGFDAEAARHLDSPFAGDAFMALELGPGALHPGRVDYPPPFARL